MMSKVSVYEEGSLIEQWNDVAQTYSDFRTNPATVRPYTAEEIAEAGVRTAESQATESRRVARLAVKAIITDLQAERARCDVVIAKSNAQTSGADTKDIARAAKRIADAAIDLARFIQDN